MPKAFDNVRLANGSPALADAPSDQDVLEFELEFHGDSLPTPRLDILTTNAPSGNGAIARFLNKFGEGIQQIEIDVTSVDRATQILRERFKIEADLSRDALCRILPYGTRVNFFLVAGCLWTEKCWLNLWSSRNLFT